MIKRNQVCRYIRDNHPVIYIPGRVSSFHLNGKYARFIDAHNMDRIVLTSDLEAIPYRGYWRSRYLGNDEYIYHWAHMLTLRQLKRQSMVRAYGYNGKKGRGKIAQKIAEMEALAPD